MTKIANTITNKLITGLNTCYYASNKIFSYLNDFEKGSFLIAMFEYFPKNIWISLYYEDHVKKNLKLQHLKEVS